MRCPVTLSATTAVRILMRVGGTLSLGSVAGAGGVGVRS